MPTEKEVVFDRLRRQKEAEEIVDGDLIRVEWLKAVDELMKRLVGWLSDGEKEGLFTVDHENLERTETRLGTYSVPGLKLTTPQGETIRIAPRARYVLGAYGRVDLECPPKKSILVRTEPDRWQFARLDPGQRGWVNRDLDEDSFWQSIGDLIS